MIEMGWIYGMRGERRDAYRVLVGNLREGDHLEDPGVDEMIIAKWIFKKWDGATDSISLSQDKGR
jgi:hypothetical protein